MGLTAIHISIKGSVEQSCFDNMEGQLLNSGFPWLIDLELLGVTVQVHTL